MRNSTSQKLYGYWNEIRGRRMAPRRFEIEPARFPGLLPDIFLLERVDADLFRYRLAGTRICDHFGTEFRGASFLGSWTPEDAKLLIRQLGVMTNQAAVGLFTFEARTLDGRLATFEMLLLPLVHSQDQIDRFLGGLSSIDKPRWLGTERLFSRRLLTHELIWPDGRPHAVIERGSMQVPFLPHVRSARIVKLDRRQFRVYQGGLSKSDDPPKS